MQTRSRKSSCSDLYSDSGRDGVYHRQVFQCSISCLIVGKEPSIEVQGSALQHECCNYSVTAIFSGQIGLVRIPSFSLHLGHPCEHKNGGCEHVCIPTPTGRRCACSDGFNFVHGDKCSIPTCEFVPLIDLSKKSHRQCICNTC